MEYRPCSVGVDAEALCLLNRARMALEVRRGSRMSLREVIAILAGDFLKVEDAKREKAKVKTEKTKTEKTKTEKTEKPEKGAGQ